MPPGTDTPDNVYAAFRNAAQNYPARTFLRVLPETARAYGIEPGDHRYENTLSTVDALTLTYRSAGYRYGQRVALLLENRPQFFHHWFALNALGVSVVPVNPDLRAAELRHIFSLAEPVLAVAIQSRREDLSRAADSAGVKCPVVALDGPIPSCVADSIQSEPSAQSQNQPAVHSADIHASTEAAMLFTSGTTGLAKGCVLSNEYFLQCGHWYSTTGGLMALEAGVETMLTPLPLFHMNAMACSTMAMVMLGGTLCLLDRFHPNTWWQAVRESRATCLHYLGVMPTLLMQAPESHAERDHTVRFGFGAGIDPELHAAFGTRFGFPLIEAWAMTETGNGAVIAATHGERRVGSSNIGRPADDVEIRVVADSGENAAANEPGELLVRHAGENPHFGFFSAYHKDQQATADAWQNGWFHTGDIVRRDAQGYVTFVDRKKNVIRRSGENIAAVEVESTLIRHPRVAAAAVCAVPDDVRGDEVFACVVTEPASDPDASTLASEITTWLLGELAYYKAPGFLAFVDALPLTATQKIQRGELKALALAILARNDAVDVRALKKRNAI